MFFKRPKVPTPTIKPFLVGWLIVYLFVIFFLPGYGLMLVLALPVGAGVASMLPRSAG